MKNVGYDTNIVLLENGEFECGGNTFTYEGNTIFVGDVLDNEIQMLDFDVAEEGYKGCFIVVSTGHILCKVSTYVREYRKLIVYDEFVYAPNFDEMYETASDFVESRIKLLQTYQPTKEYQNQVDYCSYKGRLFKNLVVMSDEELQTIDNGKSGDFSISDVGAYIDWLNQEAHKPSTWAKGVNITEEHIDYHIRNQIEWGIHYCEKYCSPSVEFFRLADKMYKAIRE